MKSSKYAYAAGIIDGEGCITGSYLYKVSRGVYQTSYQVSVANKSRELLYWLKRHFGGKVYTQGSRILKWELFRLSEIRSFLQAILPYLIIKKKQAELMVAFCNSRLDRLNNVKNNRLAQLTKVELGLLDEIKRLNKYERGTKYECNRV